MVASNILKDDTIAVCIFFRINVSDTQAGIQALENLKEIQALQTAHSTLNHCIDFIEKNNININADELRFGMYIADPKKLEL